MSYEPDTGIICYSAQHVDDTKSMKSDGYNASFTTICRLSEA